MNDVNVATLYFTNNNGELEGGLAFNTDVLEQLGHTLDDFVASLDDDYIIEFANYILKKLRKE